MREDIVWLIWTSLENIELLDDFGKDCAMIRIHSFKHMKYNIKSHSIIFLCHSGDFFFWNLMLTLGEENESFEEARIFIDMKNLLNASYYLLKSMYFFKIITQR